MITVSELEQIIAETPPGEQVQYEAKPIGSDDHVTRKLTELKLSRSSDPDFLIFVGMDRFGECRRVACPYQSYAVMRHFLPETSASASPS